MIDICKLKEFDKYNGESAILEEPWVEKNKLKITQEEFWLLEEYIDNLFFLKSKYLSTLLKKEKELINNKLEKEIHPDVIEIINARVMANNPL